MTSKFWLTLSLVLLGAGATGAVVGRLNPIHWSFQTADGIAIAGGGLCIVGVILLVRPAIFQSWQALGRNPIAFGFGFGSFLIGTGVACLVLGITDALDLEHFHERFMGGATLLLVIGAIFAAGAAIRLARERRPRAATPSRR